LLRADSSFSVARKIQGASFQMVSCACLYSAVLRARSLVFSACVSASSTLGLL